MGWGGGGGGVWGCVKIYLCWLAILTSGQEEEEKLSFVILPHTNTKLEQLPLPSDLLELAGLYSESIIIRLARGVHMQTCSGLLSNSY